MSWARLALIANFVAIAACGLLLPSNYGREIVSGGEFLPNSSLFIRTLVFSINQNYLNSILIFSYVCLSIVIIFVWKRSRDQHDTANKHSFVVTTCLLFTIFCAFQVQGIQKFQGGFPLTRDYGDDLASLVDSNDEGEKLTRKWATILKVKSLVGEGILYSSNAVLNDDLIGIGQIDVIIAPQLSGKNSCQVSRSRFQFLGYIQEKKVLYKASQLLTRKNFTLFTCGSEILIQ